MQSFKPSLNGCKALYTCFTGLACCTASAPRPPEPQGAHAPPRPPAVPVCIDHACTEAPRAARTQARADKSKAFPLTGSPLPCPGTCAQGGSCIPQLLLKSQRLGAFLSAQRQVPGVGIQVRAAFSPGCQPPVLAGHTRDSTQYFLNTQTPADVCH